MSSKFIDLLNDLWFGLKLKIGCLINCFPKAKSTPEKIDTQWASIKINLDFLNIQTCSGYSSSALDTEGENIYLAPHSNDFEIGSATLKALEKSRIIDPQEFSNFFGLDRLKTSHNEWIQYCQKTYGYKTKKLMFKDMHNISCERQNGFIKFQPMHHEKLEGWSVSNGDNLHPVIIPAESKPEEVGKALRLAYSRCTTKGF